MKWKLLFLLSIFSLSVMASDHQVYYDKGNTKIFLTSTLLSEADLNIIGKAVCGSINFCILWIYTSEDEAAIGARAMQIGDMYAETRGLYAIYSRNKVNDQIICYEPKSGC